MANKLNILYVDEVNKLINFADNDKHKIYYVKSSNFDNEIKELIEFEEKFQLDLVILEKIDKESNLLLIDKIVEPYRVLYLENIEYVTEDNRYFLDKKMAKSYHKDELESIAELAYQKYYRGQGYGDKISIQSIAIDKNFKGEVSYFGYDNIRLSGEFGNDFKQLFTWKSGYSFVEKDEPWETFLEYEIEGDCEIQLAIDYIPEGETKILARREKYTKEDLKKPIRIYEKNFRPNLIVSLYAKGVGEIKVGGLHFRKSREEIGVFYPGGQQYLDNKNQEILYYFHPGDFTPPLNVYFSGYHSREGFEGYYFMKSFNKPFLLISDSGLEGGSFYMRSKEIQDKIIEVINGSLDYLGFNSKQLTTLGLSMGTFGALYYGSKCSASNIVLGKPLFSLNNIANNIRTIRPGMFSTILDVVNSVKKNNHLNTYKEIDEYYWQAFEDAKLKDTTIIVSYMKDDDYDGTAFVDLLNKMGNKNIKIISKGIVGRHNDNTAAIVNFIKNQYTLVLEDTEKK